MDYFPGYVGEAEVATLIAVGELLVVDAQEVEQGGLDVVDMQVTARG